jgi:hypothetical protein
MTLLLAVLRVLLLLLLLLLCAWSLRMAACCTDARLACAAWCVLVAPS